MGHHFGGGRLSGGHGAAGRGARRQGYSSRHCDGGSAERAGPCIGGGDPACRPRIRSDGAKDRNGASGNDSGAHGVCGCIGCGKADRPEALQAPDPAPADDKVTPLADVGYIGWMNGTSRENAPIFDTKFFTPEIRFDANYLYDSNHPKDHTIDGSTEEFRSGEFQIEQVSFGGDFHWDNVRARFLTMFGLFSTTTPRNDGSQAVGQWDLQGAYKYISEANGGYHFDVAHGLNVDAGIFVSYIGLFSYYNYDNWTYQPSFVSSNTPWFFNGLRVQFWPTQHLKIEPWLINGWQSYAKFNSHPGLGGQILWIPNDSLKLVFNTYTLGQDNISNQFTNGVPLNAGNNGNQLAHGRHGVVARHAVRELVEGPAHSRGRQHSL